MTPAAFAGIDAAVELVLCHVRAGTRVTVHGDYDVDGVCSTAILVRVLRGARRRRRLVPAQPHGGRLRAQRGDGASGWPSAARGCCSPPTARSPRSMRSRRRARLGLDVVVTDHHSPRADGVAARCADRAPRRLRLPVPGPVRGRRRLQARGRAAGRRRARSRGRPTRTSTSSRWPPWPTASRCATRTAASCARACTRWPRRAKPGIRALLRVAKVDPGALDARAIGFRLAPRINAAGRLYRADAGLELVLTDDPERAAAIADELDHANAERRHTETRILFEAEAQVRELGVQPAYVLAGEGWHPGVIGIVASRIAERHHRPCVMLALDGDEGTGLGALDPRLRPARRARRERRAPAAPRRASRRGGLHDRARGGRRLPRRLRRARARRSSPPRTSSPPSASTPSWPATSSASRWPRSSSSWRPSGSATRRCRCSCRPRGWSTRGRWGRRAATCASPSRPAGTAPARSPSG